MPHSDPTGKDWTIKEIVELNPRTILDVGPGSGTYGRMLSEHGIGEQLDAVEIWEPYVEQFNLKDVYDHIYLNDVRIVENFNYDLVIFGDVLEHMEIDEAVEVWFKIKGNAVISIPIVHYPQGPYEGNPYETHVHDHWDAQQVLDNFKGIKRYEDFGVTGVFLTW